MNTSFQKTAGSDEWYTPPEIVRALGPFDLDPCSPERPLFKIAEKTYNKQQDGLAHEWAGRVFLNPPYSQPLLSQFCEKMAGHGNGIVLVFARTGNKVMQEILMPKADAMLFMRKRVRFYLPDGKQGGGAGCDSVLIAFGKSNADALKNSGIEGFYVGRDQWLGINNKDLELWKK